MLNNVPKDLFYCYLAGTMLGGEAKKQTVDWRYKIRKHYENWKDKGRYEIIFLDPWNGEIDSVIDAEGITNERVQANAIFHGDKMAIKKADLIIANLNQFNSPRISIGTFCEIGIALALNKPVVLITDKNLYARYSKHPFTSQAVAIYKSIEEFLDSKILNWFYKRVNSAIYEWEL